MWFLRERWLGNFDHGGANQTTAQEIPRLDFFHHRLVGLVVGCNLLHDFVSFRIEGLAQRLEPLHTLARQELVQLPVDQFDAGHHRILGIVMLQTLQRCIETVHNRQER